MKKWLLICLLVCYGILLLSAAVQANALLQPKKIAVIELMDNSKTGRIEQQATDAIRNSLVSAQVVQAKFEQAFLERGLVPKGIIDLKTVSSVGASLGLDYIIMGSIKDVSYDYRPGYEKHVIDDLTEWVPGTVSCYVTDDIMLVDVKTAMIVWHDIVSGCNSRVVWEGDERACYNNFWVNIEEKIISEYGPELLQDSFPGANAFNDILYGFMPEQGSITKIEGGKYYIDLGKQDGLTNGIDLYVDVPGGRITEAIYNNPPSMLRIVDVSDGYCVAELRRGKATDIQINDVVCVDYSVRVKYGMWVKRLVASGF